MEMRKEADKMMRELSVLSQIPGAMEMLHTMAAQELGPKSKTVRLYNMGGPVEYESGGLASAAEAVRAGGRGDDEVLLHVSPEEYEALVAMWGEPEINPETGLPEYGFLSKLWKKVKKTVKKIVKSPIFQFIAPIALNAFAPGLGSAIGGALGLGGKAAGYVGNALVRGGIGAMGGGKEGALSGAIGSLTMGSAGADLGGKLGLSGNTARLAGDALIGAGGAAIGGGDPLQGALGNAMYGMTMRPVESAVGKGMKSIFGGPEGGGGKVQTFPYPEPGTLDPGTGAGDGIFGDLPPVAPAVEQPWYSKAWDYAKEHPVLVGGGALMLANAMQGPGGDASEGAPPPPDPSMNQPLPQFTFNRQFQGLPNAADYYTYGQAGGEHNFFQPNNIGTPATEAGPPLVHTDLTPNQAAFANLDLSNARSPLTRMMRELQQRAGYYEGGYVGYASGGRPVGHAKGNGSGRDDTIEALLSDGEFVFDAESVSMLGDGSNEEGARRLEELRQKLRQHKGKALSKGKFSPNAHRPEQYLKKYLGAQFTEREAQQMMNMSDSDVLNRMRQMMGGQFTEREGRAVIDQMRGRKHRPMKRRGTKEDFIKRLQQRYGE